MWRLMKGIHTLTGDFLIQAQDRPRGPDQTGAEVIGRMRAKNCADRWTRSQKIFRTAPRSEVRSISEKADIVTVTVEVSFGPQGDIKNLANEHLFILNSSVRHTSLWTTSCPVRGSAAAADRS
jgi:hypothetical protein